MTTPGADPTVSQDATVRGFRASEQPFAPWTASEVADDNSPSIEFNAIWRDGMRRYEAADSGMGVDPPYSVQPYGGFDRLHYDKEYPRTGIGPAICKQNVGHHGVDIWTESEPDDRSTFPLTLAGE